MRIAAGLFVAVVSLGALAPRVFAQGAAAQPPLTCAQLLTAAELKAAVGPGFEDMGPVKRKDGETECSWMARGAGGLKTVALSFFEPPAIEGSMEAFFDSVVKATEEAGSSKHEPLVGIGLRAALVPFGEQKRLYVQTKAGVGQISALGVTKAQALAIAKAVATP